MSKKYEIECQDDIDPLRPEIRNYAVGGVDAPPVYELWQLPDEQKKYSLDQKIKWKYTDMYYEQGRKQPALYKNFGLAYFREMAKKGVGMTAVEVSEIRREWEAKKKQCGEYVWRELYRDGNVLTKPDLTKIFHDVIFRPQCRITGLLRSLGEMTTI